VRDNLRAAWGGQASFDAALARGGAGRAWARPAPASRPVRVAIDFEPQPLAGNGADPVLVVYPSHHLYDGRLARVQALQEIPDPVTKTMWGSYAELHPETATALGVELGDVLVVSTEGGEVEITAYPHQAVRPGVIVGRPRDVPRDPDAPLSGQAVGPQCSA
jgi:molybdopterin-containing oxidoreductase family iron-sulfur binding subunit